VGRSSVGATVGVAEEEVTIVVCTSGTGPVSLVIWSLWLVWFNQINKINQTNQLNETSQIERTDQMNKTGCRTVSASC
jgi:hypothetical protein